MAAAAVDARVESYRRLNIYSTKSRLYVVGHDEHLGVCRFLKFRRQDGPRLDVVEDPLAYTPQQCNLVLRKVHEQSGGLQLICKGHGIIGCFKFTDSYYLLVVARREFVGHICGHKVYRIAETSLISLSASQQRIDMSAADNTAEKRYRKLLLGVDLTKNFFFSYSYSLAHTLQHNHTQATAAAAAAAPPASDDPAASSSPVGPAAASAAAAAAAAVAAGWEAYDSSMFVWNAYLTRPLRVAIQSNRWTLPLVHGFWEQRQVSVFGRQLTLTLLARRSRHFAGTRFRKRGLSAQGFVANEVETEQIVDAGIDWATGQPLWSALVQVRGSVPLFWSQQATPLSPKPDILLQQFDPIYEKTAAHFADLQRRYGHPIIALNLLKSKERRPREVLLRREYAAAVALLNAGRAAGQRVVYLPWDFNKVAKQPGANILLEIEPVMSLALDASGIYVHSPATCPSCQPAIAARFAARAGQPPPACAPAPGAAAAAAAAATSSSGSTADVAASPQHQEESQQQQEGAQAAAVWPGPKQRHFCPVTQLQQGVLRTNCIDCLDRTNVVQFAYGLAGFGRQLAALGVLDGAAVDGDSGIAFQLMEMYECMGHTLALQYGGSEAHAAFFQKRRGEWEAATQSRDLMTSIRRFYSNTYTDAEKQDAINLFLGNFVPHPTAPHLWELDSDYYLHTDAAIRYSQLVGVDRMPPLAAAAATAAVAAVPGAPAGPPAVMAGGRNAPVILRQLSATTLPPNALGFASSAAVAAGVAPARPAAAWTPFAAATAVASAAAADSDGDGGGSSSGRGGRLPAAALAGCSTPMLPLTFSDGISIDASEADSSPSAAEGAFNFKAVFQQMLAPADAAAPAAPTTQHSAVVSFDNVLAKLPRARPVRLYPVTARNNVMWDAVQQAFAFFSTTDGAAAGDGGAAAAVGASSSGAAPAAGAAAGAAAAGSAAAAADASALGGSSIQALDLTKRLQPAAAAAAGGAADAAPDSSDLSSSLGSRPGSMQVPAAAGSSSSTAAGGFISAIATNLTSNVASIGQGLRSPPAPAVSNLNDILEIRTDVTAVRLISQPDRPPQAFGPEGPVLPPRARLDATLDELMWAQFGINITNNSSQITPSANPGSPTIISRGSGAAGTPSGLQGSSGSSGSRLLLQQSPSSSPIAAAAAAADKGWGVFRGFSRRQQGPGAPGQQEVSPLNDILGIEKRPAAAGVGPGSAAAGKGMMLAGGSSGGSRKSIVAGAGGSSLSQSRLAVGSPMAAGAAGSAAGSRLQFSDAAAAGDDGSRPRQRPTSIDCGSGGGGDSTSAGGSSSSAGGSPCSGPPLANLLTCGRVTFTSVADSLAAAAALSHSSLGGSRLLLSAASGGAAAAAAAAPAAAAGGGPAFSPPSTPSSSRAAAAGAAGDGAAAAAAPEWVVVNGHAVCVSSQPCSPTALVSAGSISAAAAAAAAAAAGDTPTALAAASNVVSYWTTPFKKQQGMAAVDAGGSSSCVGTQPQQQQPGLASSASRAAAARQQQQQRWSDTLSMFAPVDEAAAAAALGLECVGAGSSNRHGISAAATAPAAAAPDDAFSHAGCLTAQQRQQQQSGGGDDSTSNAAAGAGAACSNGSSGGSWQSSADVAGASLAAWGDAAGKLGVSAELEAVWWHRSDMAEAWALAALGSREAYRRYCRGVSQLLEPAACEGLRQYYERQQFQTPVVLGGV